MLIVLKTCCFTLFFFLVVTACSNKEHSELDQVEIKNVVVQTIETDIPPDPPPPPKPSDIKQVTSFEESLHLIINAVKTTEHITTIQFGAFESKNNYFVYYSGINENIIDTIDSKYTQPHIVFSSTYYSIPKNQYGDLTGEQVRNKMILDFKKFAASDIFQKSPLSKAERITSHYIITGFEDVVIWSKANSN